MSAVARPLLRFLRAEQVQILHRIYVNSTGEGTATLLDSAVQYPMNRKHCEGENDVANLAALLATNAFLRMNGKVLQKEPLNPTDEALNVRLSDLHVQVATGACDEKRLAEVYRPLVRNSEVTPEVVDMRAKGIEGQTESKGIQRHSRA